MSGSVPPTAGAASAPLSAGTAPVPPSAGTAPAPHLDTDESNAEESNVVDKVLDGTLNDVPGEETEKGLISVQPGENVNLLSESIPDDELSAILPQ